MKLKAKEVECCIEGVRRGTSTRCKGKLFVKSKHQSEAIACALDATEEGYDMACSSEIFTDIKETC